MVTQVTSCCFRAILPGGNEVQRGLNVIKLATCLTQHDPGASILWSVVANAERNVSLGMPPIHDIQPFRGGRRETYLGSMTASWLDDQPRAVKKQDSLLLYLKYKRQDCAVGTYSHGNALPQSRLYGNLCWGRATVEVAVAYAHPAVTQLLLDEPYARHGAGFRWTVPAACPPSEFVRLVRPCSPLSCDSASA